MSVRNSSFFAATGDLTELNELFNLYWRRIIPLGQTSSIAFPFSRLHNEPFWELVPLPGNEMIPATVNMAVVTSDISPLIRPPATFSLMEKGCVDLRKWNE